MNATDVYAFEEAYNAAGIRDESAPPPSVLEAAAHAEVIAASDMIRAIASAQRLAPEREIAISPLLRELTLEPPSWVTFRLPVVAWDFHNHVQWTYRLWRTYDHDTVRRAIAAAEWLHQQANGKSTLLAVTHGGFRRVLDARLVACGWRREPGRRSYANWSMWSYAK
jgi:broad specificity phosphatase PhoE